MSFAGLQHISIKGLNILTASYTLYSLSNSEPEVGIILEALLDTLIERCEEVTTTSHEVPYHEITFEDAPDSSV